MPRHRRTTTRRDPTERAWEAYHYALRLNNEAGRHGPAREAPAQWREALEAWEVAADAFEEAGEFERALQARNVSHNIKASLREPPPASINVIDAHGGFTAVTRGGLRGHTLWRPGRMLKKTTIGRLTQYDPKSFFQTNNDVTQALYKVAGYRYPVAVWFDNKTGRRIA